MPPTPRTSSRPAPLPNKSIIPFAKRVLHEEAQAVEALAGSISGPQSKAFAQAVGLIVHCANSGGNVLVTGLGKSGLIGAKISATFASIGIPSHNVHPSEAAHGDLGRFRANDLAIAISFSGETEEVVNLAAILRQDKLPIISITNGTGTAKRGQPSKPSRPPSRLERLATVPLTLGIAREAGDGDFVAPTSSTTATLALGDALGLCAARIRNFTSEDFRKRHPGGALGGLLRPITELLRSKNSAKPSTKTSAGGLPLVHQTMTVAQALAFSAANGRRPGALIVIDAKSKKLAGIFTDGDLRRLVLKDPAALQRPIGDVMTRTPRTLPDTARVQEAVLMFREHRQDEIPVVDAAGKPVGLLDVQDLIAMRLVEE